MPGAHCPHPPAVLTVSSLKPQAADQHPKLLPTGQPEGWLHLWSAVSNAKISLYSLKQGMGNGQRTRWEEYRAHLSSSTTPRISANTNHLLTANCPTAPKCSLPALPRGHWEHPCRSPRISMPPSSTPGCRGWGKGVCRLRLSLEDHGLVAAGVPAPRGETYGQI